MSIWIIEINRNGWLPYSYGIFLSPEAAAKYVNEEWPNQPNYARVVEYVRKETE